MKYKRLGALLCALLFLTGCSWFIRQEENAVAILARNAQQDPAEQQRVEALQERLGAAGYTVQVFDARDDQAAQIGQLEKALQENCVGVVMQPVMLSAAPQLVDMAKTADVPLIFTGRPVEEETLQLWDKLGYVGADPEQPGMQQGSILAALPDKGDINGDGMLSYILIWDMAEYTDTQLHTASVFTALTDAQVVLMQLGISSAEGDREKAREGCATLLCEYGKDIEAVICSNDEMALGALEAIKEGGRTVGENVYLLGIGGGQEALQAVTDGNMTGTVQEDTNTLTNHVLQLLQQLEKGEAEQRSFEIDCIPVTK